jgi:soluble lytic murein transglycosylase-like protein
MFRGNSTIEFKLGALIVTILILLIIFLNIVPMLSEDSGPKTPYDHIIRSVGIDYRIETALIKAVMKMSSDFDASLSGERIGLMGITEMIINDLNVGDSSEHCDKMEVKDPKDPGENIRAGTCYLSYLLDRYDNNRLQALIAYRWNPSKFDAVDKNIERVPGEPRSYANNVMGFYNEYKKTDGWDFV